MNGRRMRTSILVILFVIGLGSSLVLALTYLGVINSFTVTASSDNQNASPIATAISRLIFAAITVCSFALLGWFCLRSLKRRKDRDGL